LNACWAWKGRSLHKKAAKGGAVDDYNMRECNCKEEIRGKCLLTPGRGSGKIRPHSMSIAPIV
jgi:hypothetical protein